MLRGKVIFIISLILKISAIFNGQFILQILRKKNGFRQIVALTNLLSIQVLLIWCSKTGSAFG
jgi:hypothetical protein